MGFIRSKSRGPPEEVETQRRNRLSKPQTKKSQTNLRSVGKQELGGQETHTNNASPHTEGVLSPSSRRSSKADISSELLNEHASPTALPPVPATLSMKSGVASLVARFETSQHAPSTSQLSLLGATQPKRPLSVMLNSNRSASKTDIRRSYIGNSTENRTSLQTSKTYRASLTEPLEHVTDPATIPLRRKSRYNPGEATREPSPPEVQLSTIIKNLAEKPSEDEISTSPTDEGETSENNSSCPSAVRSVTPTGLERASLGNLSLGSLHITNGRASSTFSDQPRLSKDLKLPAPSRDVSSVYGSEAWEDDVLPEDAEEKPFDHRLTAEYDMRRTFSYNQGEEDRLVVQSRTQPETHTQTPPRAENRPPRTPTSRPRRNTSVVAREYIAELPASPYAESQSAHSTSPTSSTGSVIRHEMEEEDDDTYESIQDEPSSYSYSQQQRVVSGDSRQSTESKPSVVESKLSSVGSEFAQDEVFQSALEFPPPKSPDRPMPAFVKEQNNLPDSGYSSNNSARSVSIDEPRLDKPQLETITERPKEPEKRADSPRKFGNLFPLRPALKTRATAPAAPVVVAVRPKAASTKSTITPSVQSEPNPPKMSKLQKKLQKSRPNSLFGTPKPAKDIVVQRMSSQIFDIPAIPPLAIANLGLRSQVIPELEHTVGYKSEVSSTGSSTPAKEIRFPSPNPLPEDDDRQSRNNRSRSRSRSRSKSRRRSFLSIFRSDKEVDNNDAKQGDQTMTIDNLGDVMSTLGTNPYDIALPLIKPRHSYTDLQQRSQPQLLQQQHHHHHHHHHQQPYELTPYNVSSRRPRPRSMMDDKEASELARHRSRSIHERDEWNERRASFNDRGGLPGRNVRVSSTAEDAPPVPPLPGREELKRISWRRSLQAGSQMRVRTPCSERLAWTPEVSPEPESQPEPQPEEPSAPPPPPPPHSPQPSFRNDRIEYFDYSEEPVAPPPPPSHSPQPSFRSTRFDYFDQHQDAIAPPPPSHSPQPSFHNTYIDYFDYGENVVAPPPPSHSPRPMDVIEPQLASEDPWAAQAQAWKSRRQSAGEALRARWSTDVEIYHDTYGQLDNRVILDDDDQLYPEVPPRHEDHYYAGPENQPPRLLSSQTWSQGRQFNDDRYENNDWEQPRYNEPNGYEHGHRNEYESNAPMHQNHQPVQQDRFRQSQTSNPTPRPRSTSRHSAASYRSLAEDLHPPELERRSPAPEWSRYSGGLGYGYEGRDKGFTGSAGMRNVSGNANGAWKGAALRRSWGVDLGDVPVMGVAYKV